MTDRNQSRQHKPNDQSQEDNRRDRNSKHPAQKVNNANYFNDEFETGKEEEIGREEARSEKAKRENRK